MRCVPKAAGVGWGYVAVKGNLVAPRWEILRTALTRTGAARWFSAISDSLAFSAPLVSISHCASAPGMSIGNPGGVWEVHRWLSSLLTILSSRD